MKYITNIDNTFINSLGKTYKVILMDPPWSYNNKAKGSADKVYNTMSLDELKNLNIDKLTDSDCVLFMWATFPLIQEALDLIKSYRFIYKTGLSWHKKTRKGKDYFGNGFIFRSAAELLLVAYKGHPKPKNRHTRNSLDAVCMGHSIKPEKSYKLITDLFDGPYLELFSRLNRKGWDCVGNEIEEDLRLF